LSDLRQHLEGQLAEKKTALVETEENLRKYVGDRAVDNQQQGRPMRTRITAPGAARGGRRSLPDRLGQTGDGDVERDEDVVNKSVMSRVVKEVKSRDETIEEQKTDKKSAARNKRMFGALVGTLQKFNKEEVKKKDVTEKKKIVEMKVEERTEKEKEEIKNRKRELFSDQKKKKKDIQIIQTQMKRVEDYEIWEKSKQQEVNFIRTTAQPELYWLPKTHTEKSKEQQLETKAKVEKEIETRKEEFEEELLAIEKRMSLDLSNGRTNGSRGDIRDRLDLGRNGKLNVSLDSNEADDMDGSFMADRRVVERDGDKDDVNGGVSDLRMTLKNNLASERKKSVERTVIVKDEKEVEERKRRKEEERVKEEERRIRKEEEQRREKRKAEDAPPPVTKPEVTETKEKEASKKLSPKAEQKSKRRARDSSSDSDEEEKSKKSSAKKRRRTKSGRSSRNARKEKNSKRDSSDSSSSSEEEPDRKSRKRRSRSSSSSDDSDDGKSKKKGESKRERKRGRSRTPEKPSKKSSKKKSKRESSSEDSSSDSD